MLIPSLTVASECPQFFHKPITLENSIVFCKSFFAVVYDDEYDRPLFSTELVQTSADLKIGRIKFYDEKDQRIQYDEKNHPDGYDRGHLAPAFNSSNEKEFNDTFTYINTVPQHPNINRGVWRVLEETTRYKIIYSGKPTIIVTGGIYEDESDIPVKIFKIVFYDQPKAYVVDNIKGAKVKETSIEEIENMINVELD
jgi:endonuclease G